MESADAGLTFDEALTKQVGQFGPGQWMSLLWASLPQVANAAAYFLWVFITTDSAANKQWECVDPADAACTAVWQQDTPSTQGLCSLQPDQWRWTSQDSLVASLSLVCDNAWKVQFANSLMCMGAFLASGIFGFLCDRWGRKRPLFLATALVAVSMYASLAAPSYWAIAGLRALTGFGAAGQSHCIFLLSAEPVGPDFRGLASIATLMLFAVGEFLMVALGYALPNWRHLVLAAASINAAALLLYPVVSESARWLLSQGRVEEATAILQKVARRNKSSMPAQRLVSSKPQAAAVEEGMCSAGSNSNNSSGDTRLGLLQLLKQRKMAIRLIILLINWFSLLMNYYGLGMGSGGIQGSIYVTFAIGVVAEVIALLIVGPTVDTLGRHNIVALGQLLGGAACLACAMVNSGGITQAVLAGVGKFGCSAAESVISIYTAELLPTSCRSSVLGVCSQAARLGSIAAPFLLMLGAQLGSVNGHSQVFIPFMVFGCLAVLGGVLTLFMPETLGAAMPEKAEDLNMLLSAFTAKPWRQGCSPLLAFIFRTKAASAYAANQWHMPSAAPACRSASSIDALPRSTGANNTLGKDAGTREGFDSSRVADRECTATLYGDDSELRVAHGGDVQPHPGAVVVSVHVVADSRSGVHGPLPA